jgi:hypothetical protein
MKQIPINPRISHIDTTNFSVSGNYENAMMAKLLTSLMAIQKIRE